MTTQSAFNEGLNAAMNYKPADWANIGCPYVAKENRDAWFAGLRAGQEIERLLERLCSPMRKE